MNNVNNQVTHQKMVTSKGTTYPPKQENRATAIGRITSVYAICRVGHASGSHSTQQLVWLTGYLSRTIIKSRLKVSCAWNDLQKHLFGHRNELVIGWMASSSSTRGRCHLSGSLKATIPAIRNNIPFEAERDEGVKHKTKKRWRKHLHRFRLWKNLEDKSAELTNI